MKKPGWVNWIGIIGIIWGVLGLLGAGQTLLMPKLMAMQQEMMPQIQKTLETSGQSTSQSMDMLSQMMDHPDWFGTWCVAVGIIALVISAFYIYASILLLQLKKSAIRLFYIAIGLSVSFIILRALVTISAMPLWGMSYLMYGVIGLVIQGIVIFVVLRGDKQAFG